MQAMSCASCTEPEASSPKPIWRQAMTSEWSPKIESAWVASVRAATCMQNAVSSPAILYMLGIMRSRPCDARECGRQRAGLESAVDRARRARLGLHLGHREEAPPDVGSSPSAGSTRRPALPSATTA